MTINGRILLFVKPGHVMEEPTDADFEDLDREEAKQSKIAETREKALEKISKMRGKRKDGALADLEADLAAAEFGDE